MSDPRRGKLSASAVERRALCPGSGNAEAGIPEDVITSDDDVRESGTLIHAALADGNSDALSSEDHAVYEDMDRKARKIATDHGFDPDKFIAEERIWFEEEFSGQPDRVYLDGGRSLCIDFKSGFLPVTTASENPQLACLAILVIQKYGVAEVTVAIIPRFGAIKETATYTLETAGQALSKIFEIIAAAENPDAPRIAGEKQCKYCRYRAACPEFAAFCNAVLDVGPKQMLIHLTADKLALALDRIPSANTLIDALKSEARRRLASGDEEFAKLYGIGEGRELREIVKLPTVFARVAALGVTQEQFVAECGITLGAVNKNGGGSGLKLLIHDSTGLKGKGLNDKLDEILDGCVETKVSQGSLKRKEES